MQKVIESGMLGELLEVEMHYDYTGPRCRRGRFSALTPPTFTVTAAIPWIRLSVILENPMGSGMMCGSF